MTAEREIIIPGLDHSLCKAGGLSVWLQTPGYTTPPRRTNGARRKAKAAVGRNDGPHAGQEVLWENLA